MSELVHDDQQHLNVKDDSLNNAISTPHLINCHEHLDVDFDSVEDVVSLFLSWFVYKGFVQEDSVF